MTDAGLGRGIDVGERHAEHRTQRRRRQAADVASPDQNHERAGLRVLVLGAAETAVPPDGADRVLACERIAPKLRAYQ